MNEKEAKKSEERIKLKGTLDFLIDAFSTMRDIKQAEYEAIMAKAKKLMEELNRDERKS